MRCRPVLRAALFVALACSIGAAVLGCAARASADIDVETCPALVGLHPEKVPGLKNTYAAILYAPSARSVVARLGAFTDRGFYSIALPERTLAPVPTASPRPFDRFAYRAVPVAVRFPDDLTVYELWVHEARATAGDTDWTKAGTVECTPPEGDPRVPRVSNPDPAATASPTPEPLPTADPAIAPAIALLSPGLETLACPHPFVDARALVPVAPDYPFARAMEDGTSLVEITIDPTGSPVGSYVYKPSSEPAYDIATVQAATLTTYAPAIAFCRPIYSRYIFRAEFSSK